MPLDLHSPNYTANRVSNTAVQKATGKTWPQWFGILDKAGTGKLDHKGIVKIAQAKGAGPWWGQMVTVGYEQVRLNRQKGEKPNGFEIGVSKTFASDAGPLFNAWIDPHRRAKWLPKPAFEITKSTPSKSIRIRCTEDDSRVSVMFYPRESGKCAMTVQHSRLKTSATAEKAKKFWAARIADLQKIVEA